MKMMKMNNYECVLLEICGVKLLNLLELLSLEPFFAGEFFIVGVLFDFSS